MMIVPSETLPVIVIGDLIVGSMCIVLPIAYRKLNRHEIDRGDVMWLVKTFGGVTLLDIAIHTLSSLFRH